MDALIEPLDGEAGVSETLIVVPMMDAVLMPGTVMPLAIGRPAVAASLQAAARAEQYVVMVLQWEPFVDLPGLDDLHPVGTEARLLRYFTGRDGSHIDTVLLPARNRRDLEDIPQSARDRLRFVWLETVDDAVAATIGAGVLPLADPVMRRVEGSADVFGTNLAERQAAVPSTG